MDHGTDLSWREVVEKHHRALAEEISVRLDSQLQRAVLHAVEAERTSAAQQTELAREEAAHTARRKTAEALNQSIRRLKLLPSASDVLKLLVESSAPYCDQALVLSIENDRIRIAASRGIESVAAVPETDFNIEEAPAISAAIESKDPVTALALPREISPMLASAFGAHAGQTAYLFPVLERQKVTAMMLACGEVSAAFLELLSEAAGMRLDGLAAEAVPALPPLPNPAFVQISQKSAPTQSERRAWDDLSPDERHLHLKAQRAVRVRIAEMRLNRAAELRQGAAAGNIYGALASDIDAARTEFLQTFLTKSPSMVDYLHLEILRSLAHDDDRLLGEKYPGPMV